MRHYYLTRGWFSHESTLKEAFGNWEARYGAERAARLRKTMFAAYEQVSLIDTEAYDVGDCLEESRAVAAELELGHGIVQGSVQLLERLFRGERDSEIVTIPPAEPLSFTHLFGSPDAPAEPATATDGSAAPPRAAKPRN